MRTLPLLSDTQLLNIALSYQRNTAAPSYTTRYQDAVKALHERGYVVDLATETQESEAVKQTDEFPAYRETE